MRDDMFKVIVERPRWGWRSQKLRRGKLNRAGDTLPKKQGLKRQRQENRTQSKWLNENLAPLKRFLGQQVGRPWDKVYAEICENLSPDHTVKQHVREHVFDFVKRPRIGRDGEWIWNTPRYLGLHPRVGELYIHPHDGLLKRWKLKRGESPRRDGKPVRRR
ncbi:hypothetical protein [uncultured Maricaulis sp.]|jgi:hypothetical protein|uniref:hypothetical protein n=1 Tax=uncultured Maricaulis sp. TaxID=174710 RepID=UPI0025D09945|nr:hypothetical protein [uncultured Maricaulis sp.]